MLNANSSSALIASRSAWIAHSQRPHCELRNAARVWGPLPCHRLDVGPSPLRRRSQKARRVILAGHPCGLPAGGQNPCDRR
jgi:hypothetical protein